MSFPENVDRLFVIETQKNGVWGACFYMVHPKLAAACAFFRRERAESELTKQAAKTASFPYRIAEYRRVEQ